MGASAARFVGLLLAAVLAMWPAVSAAHASAPTVIPVGRAVGIKLFSDGVVVVGTSDIATEKGSVNPAKACGLKEGDIITHVADTPVFSLDACSSVLKDYAPGDVVTITVFRRESSMTDNTFKVDITLQGS